MTNNVVYAIGAASAVPISIPMWKARQILIEDGLLDLVYEMIDKIPDPIERRKAKDKLEYSSNMLRTDPLLIKVCINLRLTDAAVDQMFIRADRLI